MLHRRWASRFKEVRHLRWWGFPPSKASTFFGSRSQSTCTAKRPFCHRTGLPVPASAGGAQSRCGRTDSAEEVVLQGAVLERSTERFSVRITVVDNFWVWKMHTFHMRRIMLSFKIFKLWALVGACLGCACCVMWSPPKFLRKFSIWREPRCLSSMALRSSRWRWGLHDGLLYWC